MTTTARLDLWPDCPDCSTPYTLTIGLPVVLVSSGGGRYVDAMIDLELALDEDTTLACACGTQEEWSDSKYDAAAALLEPALESLRRCKEVTATYDLTDRG